MSGAAKSPLAYFHLLTRLKTTPRTGWVNHNVPNPESIADHMYRMGMITMLCPDATINKDRCVKIALVHDVAEAIVGDITPLDGVSKEDKHRLELEAMHKITKELLPPSMSVQSDEIMSLWEEYENCSTKEARFVKDVDKFELLLQAVEYERAGKGDMDLEQFYGVYNAIKLDFMKEWADEVLKEKEEMWEEFKMAKANGSA
ncbi:metal dependent phosphohydrolase [Saitoella complicata NRRL Y-17804]|uniref:5'-deoxynucleotidase n=1 Tax=Saitoella complicata (strain BCRC 22490 / CBS 7301 / JCM 7358 / NBRC 10748 / NRRL Y-17804) TaxID=698492 RepID=A0A0E9NC27_SAICN|nr:metal dependent phosphohydrolase [Saitoella complicata NRRL Y-17804]ODQ51628.1 metal dependent phosphohydrolase [Saitoella complicata NRRL Y-17804]GAO47379.1 hypothetical protein G7K_1587-t1 [Saitoella complicata NRRL Y-17804]